MHSTLWSEVSKVQTCSHRERRILVLAEMFVLVGVTIHNASIEVSGTIGCSHPPNIRDQHKTVALHQEQSGACRSSLQALTHVTSRWPMKSLLWFFSSGLFGWGWFWRSPSCEISFTNLSAIHSTWNCPSANDDFTLSKRHWQSHSEVQTLCWQLNDGELCTVALQGKCVLQHAWWIYFWLWSCLSCSPENRCIAE